MALRILTLFFVGGAAGCAKLLTCQDVDGGGEASSNWSACLRLVAAEFLGNGHGVNIALLGAFPKRPQHPSKPPNLCAQVPLSISIEVEALAQEAEP